MSWKHQHADGRWWAHPKYYECPASDVMEKESEHVWVYSRDTLHAILADIFIPVEQLAETHMDAIYFYADTVSHPESN